VSVSVSVSVSDTPNAEGAGNHVETLATRDSSALSILAILTALLALVVPCEVLADGGDLVLARRAPIRAEAPRRVLLSTPDPDGLADVPGLRLRSCNRGICTAVVRLDDLDVERLVDRVAQVELSGVRRPMLDRSLPMAGVTDEVRRLGFDGEGVLVAVIDSGIDWRHPDFRDESGATRIEYLIDVSLPPVGLYPDLEERVGAAVWGRTEIDACLAAEAAGEEPDVPVLERDTFGHGTHVASVATGSRGVAPAASLLVARVSRQDWPVAFEDADVLEAARLVFEIADALGRPCVLVLALGGHQGPHDGTSLLEQGLSDLVGPEHPGRAIAVAAGNSGGCVEHASGDPAGRSLDIDVVVGEEDPSLALDLEVWSAADGGLSFEVIVPSGETVGPVESGDLIGQGTGSAWIGLGNAPDGPDPASGGSRAIVNLRPQLSGPIEPGRYRVRVAGRGRFDAYLSWTSTTRPYGAARLESRLDPDGTLTVPGTAPELIVVGATVSRSRWVDEAGRTWNVDWGRVGTLTPYSGSGPTRGGSLKPDLVAPGHVVVAAMGRDAEAGSEWSVFTPASSLMPDRYLVVPPGDRAVLWGTSVAAPHVAGAAALLLQADPELTQDEVRSILVATARSTGGARGRAWSPRWGFGELDVERAIRLLRDGFGSEPSPATSSVGVASDVVAPGGCTAVTVVARDDDGLPLGPGHAVELEAASGAVGEPRDAGDGVTEIEWCDDGVFPGEPVAIRASIDGVIVDAEITVRVATDRRRLGARSHATGGCTGLAGAPRRDVGLRGLLGI
jgi:subtilisin family serine protease